MLFQEWYRLFIAEDDRGKYIGSTKARRAGYISVVDYYDEINNVYCSHCWDYGIEVKLSPRLLKKGEEKRADYDLFKQCPDCGTIVPVYELKHESKLEPFVEPISNSFDIGTAHSKYR